MITGCQCNFLYITVLINFSILIFSAMMKSQIKPFYSQTNILITGGTGFFGKLLIQKLLRACADIEGIYLIIRAKKNKSASERMDAIFTDVIFDLLKQERPNYATKIHLIEGDFSLLDAGLSEFNKNLIINKINIVFHCASIVNFTIDLKNAVRTNVRSLKELLSLCQKMQNLKSMVYVSTAYSNCQEYIIEEKFYDVPIQPTTLMQFVEDCKDDVIAFAEKGFLQNSPNTYCFTKSIAENVLLNDGKNLPTCLFRPSIVMSTYFDPVPGWTSNLYGPLGITFASGLGILRVMKCKKELKVDFVPADFAVNSLICSAWETHEKWKSSVTSENSVIPVYNYSGGYERNMTLEKFTRAMYKFKYPPSNPLWICFLLLVSNETIYSILNFLLHAIPGFLLDCYLYLTRQKPKFRKIYEKMNTLLDVLYYFNFHEWNIVNTNVQRLWQRLNETDKKLFPFDMDLLNYDEYLLNTCTGIKIYILKESLENVEADVKNYKKLQKIHYATVTILATLFLLFCYKILNIFLF